MQSIYNAFLGSLVADAVAMPVHWYYNTDAMDRDYKELVPYQEPRNPHPDSILWRSSYHPKNKEADILHDQAQYWGQRGVHYHQFLKAGENTLNFKLAAELYCLISDNKDYNADDWLERYVECLRTPGWHKDTYAEEYHRAFFNRRAAGHPLRSCGIDDIHIGGLATVPALLAGLAELEKPDIERWSAVVEEHVSLTHRSARTIDAAKALTRLLILVNQGTDLREALETSGFPYVRRSQLKGHAHFKDRKIVDATILQRVIFLNPSLLHCIYVGSMPTISSREFLPMRVAEETIVTVERWLGLCWPRPTQFQTSG